MDAKATLKEGLTFIATAGSGFEVRLDTGRKVGGDESGFPPLELIAMSLAGCSAMDVLSILRKKQQRVTAFETRVHADQAPAYPKVFTHVQLQFIASGHRIDQAAMVRAIELSITKYCTVYAMLSRAVPIEVGYKILEAEGASRDRLVVEGRYERQ